MAKDPKSHAESYGLSQDVAADFEAEEGPPLGAQTGRTHTNQRDAETRDLHGPKTLDALRKQVERRR
jgi:hypothetical protein